MSSWSRVKKQVRCAFGHPIWAGQLARFGRPPFVLCETHAYEKYCLLPPRVVTDEVSRDYKRRAAGEAE